VIAVLSGGTWYISMLFAFMSGDFSGVLDTNSTNTLFSFVNSVRPGTSLSNTSPSVIIMMPAFSGVMLQAFAMAARRFVPPPQSIATCSALVIPFS